MESGKKLDETQRDPQEDRKYIIRRRAVSIVSFLILIGFFAVVAIYVGKPMLNLAKDPEMFRQWVDAHGFGGKMAMVGMMVLQVVVAVIPGEPLEIGAGYAFGAWEGLLLCLIGRGDRFGNHFLFCQAFGRQDGGSLYFPGKDQFSEIHQEQQAAEPADVYSVLHSRHPKGSVHLFRRPYPYEAAYVPDDLYHRENSLGDYLHHRRPRPWHPAVCVRGGGVRHYHYRQPDRHPDLSADFQAGKGKRKRGESE